MVLFGLLGSALHMIRTHLLLASLAIVFVVNLVDPIPTAADAFLRTIVCEGSSAHCAPAERLEIREEAIVRIGWSVRNGAVHSVILRDGDRNYTWERGGREIQVPPGNYNVLINWTFSTSSSCRVRISGRDP